MQKIYESYSQDALFEKFTNAQGLTRFQQDFTDAIIVMKKGGYIGWNEIFPNDAIVGGSASNIFKHVDALKSKIKTEINPALVKYFTETFIAYMKKQKEAFSGYETLMLALGLEKNPAIFKHSDFDLKAWGGDMAADRIAMSLMYGGDRLKAHTKYGNIPVRQWVPIMKKYAKDLWGLGTIEYMAQEINFKMQGSDFNKWDDATEAASDEIIEIFRKKYKI